MRRHPWIMLFLVFRFREELRKGHDRREAADRAARKVSHVIASAAVAVSVAFGTLASPSSGSSARSARRSPSRSWSCCSPA